MVARLELEFLNMQLPDADGMPAGQEDPQAPVEQFPVPRVLKPRAGGHATPPAALSKTPTLAGLLLALRRRWLLAVSLGILLAPAAAAGVWIMRPITSSARTLLHV